MHLLMKQLNKNNTHTQVIAQKKADLKDDEMRDAKSTYQFKDIQEFGFYFLVW